MVETVYEGQVMEMWICVHDQVFGGKSRKLAQTIGCSQDEAVGLLVRLWIWGLTNCDRSGLVQYADTGTIADVLVQGLSKELSPDDIVSALFECEYLESVDDAIYIHDWSDWQRYWYSYQDRKNSNAGSKRKSRSKDSDDEEQQQKPQRTPRASGKEDYTQEFNAFWSVYPRKVNKIDAFANYRTRKKEGFTDKQMLEAAMAYAAYVKKFRKDKEHMLHPTTFLGPSLRFRDFVKDQSDEETATAPADSWANPFEKFREGKK